jgi:hypothetical protein
VCWHSDVTWTLIEEVRDELRRSHIEQGREVWLSGEDEKMQEPASFGHGSVCGSRNYRCLGGFLSGQPFLFAAGNELGESLVCSCHVLVVNFGFSEQNIVSVQLLLASFAGFAASFLSLLVLLRFKPNFLFALFGS